jgi:hypothetical protein
MAENNEFIREVNEDYRRDQVAEIWRRYSGVIIALAVLVVAGVAFLLETIGKQEVGVIVVGVLIFVTLSGVGVTALVMARARARWARAYRERHGWSPF